MMPRIYRDFRNENRTRVANGWSSGREDINFSDRLTYEQRQTLETLFNTFSDVLTDIPGTTNFVNHKITGTLSDPVRVKQYPIPFHTENVMKDVDNMLQLKFIEPSSPPYSAQVVITCTQKKDGTKSLLYRL